MKVEQRIGRIDRIGQRSPKITIWNLFYADTIDAKIYVRLYSRLQLFEKALGGLEAVLGKEIRQLTDDLLFENLKPEEEEERLEQTAQALENLRLHNNRLEENAHSLMAHGGYIVNQVKAAKDLQRTIDGEDLWIYTRDFFSKNYQGCVFNQIDTNKLIFDVQLSEKAQTKFVEFVKNHQLQGQTTLDRGRFDKVRCNFNNKLGQVKTDRIENITQFHPLIRFVGAEIKNSNLPYYLAIPVSIELKNARVPEIQSGIYVFQVEKWSVSGVREIEKLNVTITLSNKSEELLPDDISEKLFILAAKYGNDWISAAHEIDLQCVSEVAERCIEFARENYDKYISQLKLENNDRADIQQNTLRKHLENQREKTGQIIEKHRDAISIARYSGDTKKIRDRENFIKAAEAKLKFLEHKIESECSKIEQKRELGCSRGEICLGLIKVI